MTDLQQLIQQLNEAHISYRVDFNADRTSVVSTFPGYAQWWKFDKNDNLTDSKE